VRHRNIAGKVAGYIQRRAGRCRDGQLPDGGDLFGRNSFFMDDDAFAATRVFGDQFDRSGRVDPLGAVECSGRPSGDDALGAGPQPGRDSVQVQSALGDRRI
jgi:hypothetical protein